MLLLSSSVCASPSSAGSSSVPFVVVDSSAGNDANCQMINITATTPAGATLFPCASISAAAQLLANINSSSSTSGWVYMQPGSYRVADLILPTIDIVFSVNLPTLPIGSTYVFPASMGTDFTPRVWNCNGAPYCVRSFNSGLSIQGVSFRNVTFHAVFHVGATQPSDITLAQVDCHNSGGLLYKANGNANLSAVQLINGTNYPNATGYNPYVSGLVHFINTNITLTSCVFRGNFMNGNIPLMPSTMTVVSNTGFTTFHMVGTTFDGNSVRRSTSQPPHETVCYPGPGLTFNVSDISITVEASTFSNQYVKGGNVCGAGMGVFPGSEAGHGVDVQILSTLFSNNSIYDPNGNLWGAAALMIAADRGIFDQAKSAGSSPTLVVQGSTFIDNKAGVAASISLQRVQQAQIIGCYFVRNRGNIGSALRVSDGLYASITPTPLLLQNNIYEGNDSPNIQLTTRWTVNIKQCAFTNAARVVGSGSIIFAKIPLLDEVGFLNVDSCLFSNNSGMLGGAVSASAGTVTITNSSFSNNNAQLGGAVYASRTNVNLKTTTFINNSVSILFAGPSMEGGAVYGVASHFEVDRCTFSNSAVNLADGLKSCERVTAGTTVSSTWRGGAISVRESFLVLTTNVFDNSFACAGADVYADGNSVYVIDTTLSNSRAYVGGSLAIKGIDSLYISGSSFANVSALSYGGALLLLNADSFYITGNDFNNIAAETGDGGVMYFSQTTVSSSNAAFYNTFINCSAPQGGGGIAFFSAAVGLPVQPLGFADDDGNVIAPPDGEYVMFGEVQATNPFTIVSTINQIDAYAGQTFSDSYYSDPIILRITAVDSFNQTVLGNRGIVIQCRVEQADGLPSRVVVLGGDLLQQITADLEAADFGGLSITGDPGEYQLIFSVVGNPSIQSIIVPISIDDACPYGLYYSAFMFSCSACPNNLLVYDPSVKMCRPCERGRVVTADSSACSVCDLGTTNYGSQTCISCSSNTYQPTPLSRCESCLSDGMEGLSCISNDGLAAVLPGYFAYSVLLENATTPTLQTVQCPDGYCSGGFVQANWTDPMVDYMNNSALTVVPIFTSAVTRYDQCAYPRLATENNYLCGQCVPGLIVWGDKCSRCDRVDPGRMFLFLFLSFAVVMFLVRASLSSASAGHSTICLYFIQTALLEVGSRSNLLGWLQIGLLSPSSFSDCVAPLSVYQQSTFQMLMPLFLLGELLIVMIFHYVWFRFRQQDGAVPNQSHGAQSYQSAFALRSRFLAVIDAFSVDLYISASLSILLFTYTQVMMESFRLLACVDVGGVRVVYTQPTMQCDSDEYKSILVLIGIVTAYVGLFPLSVFLFLWRNNTLVQLSHDLMNRDEALESGKEPQPSQPTQDAASGQRYSDEEVSRFLLRYSSIFSMYSSRAWFWKGILLSRRIVFVAISVSLTRRPNMKFFAYGFSHLLSLLLQGFFRPFELSFFNYMEIASHVILILLSQSLTAILPPYTDRTEMYLFLLVVLPIPIYGILVMFERYGNRRTRKELEARLFERGTVDSDGAAQTHLPASPSNVGIEMGDFAVNSVAPTATPIVEAGTIPSDHDARVLPDSTVRSEDEVKSDSQWL